MENMFEFGMWALSLLTQQVAQDGHPEWGVVVYCEVRHAIFLMDRRDMFQIHFMRNQEDIKDTLVKGLFDFLVRQAQSGLPEYKLWITEIYRGQYTTNKYTHLIRKMHKFNYC